MFFSDPSHHHQHVLCNGVFIVLSSCYYSWWRDPVVFTSRLFSCYDAATAALGTFCEPGFTHYCTKPNTLTAYLFKSAATAFCLCRVVEEVLHLDNKLSLIYSMLIHVVEEVLCLLIRNTTKIWAQCWIQYCEEPLWPEGIGCWASERKSCVWKAGSVISSISHEF